MLSTYDDLATAILATTKFISAKLAVILADRWDRQLAVLESDELYRDGPKPTDWQQAKGDAALDILDDQTVYPECWHCTMPILPLQKSKHRDCKSVQA